jgi:hypothetical protein
LTVARVYRVSDSGPVESIKGVPFYSKVAYCRETTTHERRWSEVRVEIERGPEGKLVFEPLTQTLVIEPESPMLQSLREAVLGLEAPATTTPDQVLLQFRELAADDGARVNPAAEFSPDLDRQVSRAQSLESRVDYSKVHYLNSNLPWFGSGKLEAELASDGTLTKAGAESESKAAEAIVSFIPLKELLNARWVPSQEAAVADALSTKLEIEGFEKSFAWDQLPPSERDEQRKALLELLAERTKPRNYRLVVLPGGWRWTRTREWRAAKEGSCSSSDSATMLESLTRFPLASPDGTSENENGAKIQFSGEIALPEKKELTTTKP